MDRDPHGNVQVSLIETEKLLAGTVAAELKAQGFTGHFTPQVIPLLLSYNSNSNSSSKFTSQYSFLHSTCSSPLHAWLPTHSSLLHSSIFASWPFGVLVIFFQFSFCGYEGRSALPSPFDATYCYAIGRTASLLVGHNLTSLMVSITVSNITQLEFLEERGGDARDGC